MQGGDVRVADEWLRVRREEVAVEVRDHLARAEPALQRLDDVHLGIGEQRVEVVGAGFRVAGDVLVARVDAGRELDAVAARLPPLDASLDLRAHVVGAGERADADRAARRKRLHANQRARRLDPNIFFSATSSADGGRKTPIFSGPDRKSTSTPATSPPPNSM